MGTSLRILLLLFFGCTVLPGSMLSTATAGADSNCAVTSVSFAVNGAPAPLAAAGRGDHVEVAFDVPTGCFDRLTFASFVAPAPAFDGSRLDEQALYSKASGLFGVGRHSMAIDVFDYPGDTIADCGSVPAQERAVSRLPDDHAEGVVQSGRGNNRGSHDSTCDGSPSKTGDRYDKKPGHWPGGDDHNAGQECGRNRDAGKEHPAHRDCKNFQLDFSYRPTHDEQKSHHTHRPDLIAATFCIRAQGVTYTTDHTHSDAVVGS